MSQSRSDAFPAADARYPIGRWSRPETITPAALQDALLELAELPQNLRSAVADLDARQLATRYREGGWTVQQLVHHVADSHANCYVRIKLALTEDAPVIKPYDEVAWANLYDSESAPVEWSLDLLEALHARLLMLLRSLNGEQWARTFVHPEHGAMRLDTVASLYAWHSRHHVAHVTALRAAKGW
jgi:uncharacterized damage-inducible protein DinB